MIKKTLKKLIEIFRPTPLPVEEPPTEYANYLNTIKVEIDQRKATILKEATHA